MPTEQSIGLPELERKCNACDGVGVVQAPEWAAYFKATGADDDQPVPEEPEGPEEIGCGECDGEGRQLTDAGQSLAAFIRRIVRTEPEAQVRSGRSYRGGAR